MTPAAGPGGRPAPAHPITLSAHPPLPPEVEAGAVLAFAVQAACPRGCDLRGLPVEVAAGAGILAASKLARPEGAARAAAAFEIAAPRQAGEHSWIVRCPRRAGAGAETAHAGSALALRFRTVPHACSLTAWGVPSPVPAGEALTVNVGLRCAAGCRLAGARVALLDGAGQAAGAGILGEAPWPGTAALYWTDIAARAPAAAGVQTWTAVLLDAGTELPHAAAPAAFGFRTGPFCEHRAVVRVIEAASRRPVAGVEVRVGPYSASTAADGRAAVAIPKGAFDVSIRKGGLAARPVAVTVEGDLALDIEAEVVPGPAELRERAIRDHPWG